MGEVVSMQGISQPVVTDDWATERLCPKTGEECVAKSHIIDMYTADNGEAYTLQGPAGHSLIGRMNLKLAEYDSRAEIMGCEGGDPCPVRVGMDESKTRTAAVKVFRGVRRFFEGMELEG